MGPVDNLNSNSIRKNRRVNLVRVLVGTINLNKKVVGCLAITIE